VKSGVAITAAPLRFQERAMRVEECKDGCVVVVDDETNDKIIIEAIVTDFVTVRSSVRCDCGANGRRFSCSAVDLPSTVICDCCHKPFGHIGIALRVYR
jgi:hypothetical protein